MYRTTTCSRYWTSESTAVTSYIPDELDQELFDWTQWGLDLGVAMTRAVIKTKALTLICPSSPDLKASESWLSRFLDRHHLSLRANNAMSAAQEEEYAAIALKFSSAMKTLISRYKIKPEHIINLDKTPFFWEYLPRKIVCNKFSKRAAAYKRGDHHRRSTVTLAHCKWEDSKTLYRIEAQKCLLPAYRQRYRSPSS